MAVEEFVLLLPDTNVESGVAAMTWLQRELTTRFFLQGSEKTLITFSAGGGPAARQRNQHGCAPA